MAATLYNLPGKLCLTGDLPGNWKRFKQELQVYLIAAGLDNVKDPRKKAILLNVIGEEGVQIFNNFKLDEKVTFEEVIKKFEEYCEPKKNKLYSRFLFYTRSQQVGEQFDAFLKDVKSLARNCQFGDGQTIRRNTVHVKPSFHGNNQQSRNFDLLEGENLSSVENNMPEEEGNIEVGNLGQEQGDNRVQLRPRRNIVPPRYLNDYVYD